MRYQDERTGVIIDVNSQMGGSWKPVEEPSSPPASDAPEKTRKKPAKKSKASEK